MMLLNLLIFICHKLQPRVLLLISWCYTEESLSEEECSGGGGLGSTSGTLERGQQAPWTSTSKKQRAAALKAARQAELKRLSGEITNESLCRDDCMHIARL